MPPRRTTKMAKRQPRTDEGLDNEGKAPAYDPKAARAAGEAAATGQAAEVDAARKANREPEYKEVPGGDVFPPDPEGEARAEFAREEAAIAPDFDPANGPPSPGEFIAEKEKKRQERAENAQVIPTTGSIASTLSSVAPPTVKFILAMEYGGRFRVIGSESLEYLCGMAQNLPGTKRLFKEIPGQSEYQEIKANGEANHRV